MRKLDEYYVLVLFAEIQFEKFDSVRVCTAL